MVRLLTPASLASCPMLTRPAASSVILVNVLRLPVICPREAPGGGPCAASPPRALTPLAPLAPRSAPQPDCPSLRNRGSHPRRTIHMPPGHVGPHRLPPPPRTTPSPV